VELHEVGPQQWDALIAGEQQSWGGGPEEQLVWARKQRHVGVLDGEGVPLALAGALVADVAVGERRFAVVGIGSVIVTRAMRRRGLARVVIEAILAIARQLGPERAMLFCRTELTELYARFDFRPIAAAVTAEQPSGRIAMPMEAMWAPLAARATWPAGEVAVLGEPF